MEARTDNRRLAKSRKLNVKESTISVTNKNTLEYIGVWEKINNPNFNYPEFGVITQEAGVNMFIMSVGQWIVN